ncbi:glutamate 5-kinase [Seinonella peptonophila]|uniref:Glutamate 5-kinase n=1 Tax=Seinonella peptonophila TaxID=112248 RepID=A0A1M4TWJ4_9BACL|nr:glutamate 5-kinase [Seinonella peptonophila]SHE48845.1 glutamate 5-kinase [Seinonella peptonophila]
MNRVVIKIGTSSLTDQKGQLSEVKMKKIVHQVAKLQRSEVWQPVLVSSGAIAIGLESLGWSRQITVSEKQAAAAVGQGLLIEKYRQLFAKQGLQVAQLLLTRADIEDRKRFIHIRNTMETLIRHRIVPIVNENDTVAVEEIEFGDNDSLGSFVALVTEAQRFILLTDIDGLYTANPHRVAEAKRIDKIYEITKEIESLAAGSESMVGTGGMRTKVSAAKIATHSGIDVVIASFEEPNVVEKVLRNEPIGTRFYPQQRMSSKKSWLAYSTRSEGKLIIDQGAAQALTSRGSSLLLAGVKGVKGNFAVGAVVDIISEYDQLIGKGMVNFSDRDLVHLLERQSLGERFNNYHECIHRDQLVVLQEEEK